MNTDNNNFENKVGSESMGFAQNPINNSPANNLGEETFSPFQDLNNAPLNVPTDNISAAPIQNKAPDNLTFDQPSVQPQMPAQDLSFQGPVNTSNVDNSFVAPTPTTSVDQLNDAINQVPVQDNNINQGTTSFDSMQSAPAVDNSFVATQAAPTMDSFNQTVAPTFNAAPVDDLQSTPNMGINDVVNQNQYTTTSPSVETPSIEMPTNEGPTLPIPDQMPMNDYQAGVSTPVDYATPMSDFDQIGTTPELDPKAKGSKKKNKGALLILLILLIAALGGGSYYLINIKGIFNKDNVTVKEVVAEKNEALSTNIDDYATFKDTSSSNCVLDTSKVDISAVGTYDFTVTCGEKSYTGKVTVKDTKGPEIAVKTNIVTAGSSITPEMLVKNSNETATYAYASESEAEAYQTAGLKGIKLNVTDENSNTRTYTVPVIVTSAEYSIAIAAIKDVSNDNTDANIIEKDIIFYNNTAGMVNDTSYTAYIITFNNASLYKNAIANYDDSGSLTYGSYTGIPLFNSSTNTLVLVKDINTELIKDNYNDTYNSINQLPGYQAKLISQSTNRELVEFEAK